MKRLTLLLTLLCLALMFTLPVSGALFTDFEGYASFEPGGNTVYNFEDPADYWVGAWNNGGENGFTITAEIVEGKGFGGSKALAVSEDGDANVGLYLYATANNKIATNHAGAAYLRVWCDFSEVGFRKANFGVVNSKSCLFSTDEVEDAWICEFYYLAEGSNEWITMTHGDDGCFGDAQESDVYGFKGWFAFPIKDFVIRENANWEAYDPLTPCDPSDIAGIYFFWDYSEVSTEIGSIFYLDHIEFVADYKSALPELAPVAAEESAPVEAPVTAASEEQTASSPAPAAAPVTTVAAPQTADAVTTAIIVAFLSTGGIAIFKKKR